MKSSAQTDASVYIEAFYDSATLLVPLNTALPTVWQGSFSTAHDKQTFLNLHLLYGASSKASQDTSLGRWIISDILPLARGKTNITVQIHIDITGAISIYANLGGHALPISVKTQVTRVPVKGMNWAKVSLQDLLEDASRVLTEFARQHCGPSGQERHDTPFWEISVEDMHMSSKQGWIGDVTSVILDLHQIPETIICVTPMDQEEYVVRILVEKVIPGLGRVGLSPIVSEATSTNPVQLRPLLNDFIQRGILVKRGHKLSYSGKAA